MPNVNPLLKAHLLLLHWGEEALQQTGDAGKLAGATTSPAVDGPEERVTGSILQPTYVSSRYDRG